MAIECYLLLICTMTRLNRIDSLPKAKGVSYCNDKRMLLCVFMCVCVTNLQRVMQLVKILESFEGHHIKYVIVEVIGHLSSVE